MLWTPRFFRCIVVILLHELVKLSLYQEMIFSEVIKRRFLKISLWKYTSKNQHNKTRDIFIYKYQESRVFITQIRRSNFRRNCQVKVVIVSLEIIIHVDYNRWKFIMWPLLLLQPYYKYNVSRIKKDITKWR